MRDWTLLPTMYARGRTFGKQHSLRGKINEQVAEVSKMGVSMEQALALKQLEERRQRFFALLSRNASKVTEVLRTEWSEEPEKKTVPTYATREMFHLICKLIEFAPSQATKAQVDEIFDSLDNKFGKHPERLVYAELTKRARSEALANMAAMKSSREEVVVNPLMYEWEERWRKKNEKHVEAHAREIIMMKASLKHSQSAVKCTDALQMRVISPRNRPLANAACIFTQPHLS